MPPKKKAKRVEGAQASRMREIIIQQLMAQHLAKAQREKLLRALINLGISEQEYRSLVAKLGEMEVSRLAEQQAARQKYAQAVPVAQEVPAMKEQAKSGVPKPANVDLPLPPSKATKSRAELYKRLKEETAAKRKSA
jgi:hypothetical protein